MQVKMAKTRYHVQKDLGRQVKAAEVQKRASKKQQNALQNGFEVQLGVQREAGDSENPLHWGKRKWGTEWNVNVHEKGQLCREAGSEIKGKPAIYAPHQRKATTENLRSITS